MRVNENRSPAEKVFFPKNKIARGSYPTHCRPPAERRYDMTRKTIIATFVVFALSIAPQQATAADMDHSSHVGEKIHTSVVDGYNLAYHLLDLPNKDAHHLMIYLADSQGKPVTDAKVGYLVVGPGGKKQKVMAMAMNQAFGGDVDFTVKGRYTVKAKAVVGADKLIDGFTYEVK
jgi:hypothetical protein